MATNPAAPTTMPDQLRQPLVQKDGLWDRTWFNWFLKQWNTVKGSLSGSGTPTGLAIWATANTLGGGTLSGDVTTPANSTVATLANSGVTAGTYGDGTHVPQVTFDAKGRATAASNVAITANVTHTGTLTAGVPIVGNGGADVTVDPTIAVIHFVTVTLTDAQVKALPTTPIQIIPPQGSGKRIRLFGASYRAKIGSGAYTNIDPAAYLVLSAPSEAVWVSGVVPNDISVSFTYLTTLLGTAQYSVADLLPYAHASTPAADWGPIPQVNIPNINYDNVAVQLILNNNGAGNLTGGNVLNSFVVTAYFSVEAV